MCDTLAAVGAHGTLFAKNSDRPTGEIQVVERYRRRVAGPELQTQYLTITDPGAAALIGSRPTWLWGLEHGVNEHVRDTETCQRRSDPANEHILGSGSGNDKATDANVITRLN